MLGGGLEWLPLEARTVFLLTRVSNLSALILLKVNLSNAAHGELRKKGTTEFDCSVSESGDTEPQGKVDRQRSVAATRRNLRLKPRAIEATVLGAQLRSAP